MPSHPLESSLSAFLAQPKLSRLPRVLLVACSGGADSVALLRAAVEVAPGLGWRVEALHCDHGLRREAKGDAAFVESLCAQLGVTLHAFGTRLGSGPGMEARARAWRQRCYAQAAASAGARLILLAHHAQDQAETLLLNLARGAGKAGAAGMLPLSSLQGAPRILLGRPWLAQTPQALRAWLKGHKQAWREDASNRNLALARNRVRGKVLPELAAINPKAVEHLAAYAASLSGHKSAADLAGLLKLDRATRARAQALLAKGQGQADLGQGWTLKLSRGRSLVEKAGPLEAAEVLELHPGSAQAWSSDWRFQLKLGVPTARKLKQDKAFWFALPVLDSGLRIRAVRPGDRLQPFGFGPGSKLLNDLLAEARVPQWQRAGWPVLETADGILALPGVRRGRGYEASAGRKAVCLQWSWTPKGLAGQA